MKIIEIEVENFKNITSKKATPNGASMYLVGPNQSGKSSFVQAVYAALTGKEIPIEAITRGESECTIKVKVGDDPLKAVTVSLGLREGKRGLNRSLSIVDEKGNVIRDSPRTWLNDYLGNFATDVEGLFDGDKAKKMTVIAQALGLEESERHYAGRMKQLSEDRRKDDVRIKTLEAETTRVAGELEAEPAIRELRATIEPDIRLSSLLMLPYDDMIDALDKVILTESVKLETLPSKADRLADLERRYVERKQTLDNELAKTQTIIEVAGQSQVSIQNDITSMREQIEVLERRIREKEDDYKRAQSNIVADIERKQHIERMITGWESTVAEDRRTIESDDDGKRLAIEAHIEGQRAERDKYVRLRSLKPRAYDLEEKLQQLVQARREYQSVMRAIEDLASDRMAAINTALGSIDIPLEWDDVREEFTYNGFELDGEQVNTALMTELALQLVMLNKDQRLRVVRLKDAALLDETTRTRILQYAESKGFQLFLEIPMTTGESDLVIQYIESHPDEMNLPVAPPAATPAPKPTIINDGF
ncbi:MAG: hypothetical protein M5R41_19395 [Bacteroidia bacterium]|nr:hypothetical protein [Bacteroidia bacterium]